MGSPSQIYGASFAVWDHTVLSATRHRWTFRLNPSQICRTRFTYTGAMESWVDPGG